MTNRGGPTADGELPEATWEGAFTLLGVTLRCYVVNGQRIINADDFRDFVFAMESGLVLNPEELARFAAWRAGNG